MKKQNTINITKITDYRIVKQAKFNFLKHFNKDFIIWDNKRVCSNITYSNHSNNLTKDVCEKIIINLNSNNMQFNKAEFKMDLLDILKSRKQVEEGLTVLRACILFKQDVNMPYVDITMIKRILNYFSYKKFKPIIIPETKTSEECFLVIEDNEQLIYKQVELLKNIFNETFSVYNVEFINAEAGVEKNFYFISSYDCFDLENSMCLMSELTIVLQKNYNIHINDIYNSQITLETED